MKNILLITQYTFREALAKKIFITFFIISSLVILGFILFFSFFDLTKMISIKSPGEVSPQKIVETMIMGIKIGTIGPLYGGALFLSIFSTAGIIASLFEKGNIDLFLSKPISRFQLLMGKFLGGLEIVFINVAYAIVCLWVLLGLKFGVWDTEYLLSIFGITFAFAVIYALIILFTVITRSSVLPLILSYLIFFIVSPILAAREDIILMTGSKVLGVILDGLHYIIPQTSELGRFATEIALKNDVSTFEPAVTSFILMVLMLTGSIIIFNKKDY